MCDKTHDHMLIISSLTARASRKRILMALFSNVTYLFLISIVQTEYCVLSCVDSQTCCANSICQFSGQIGCTSTAYRSRLHPY